MITVILVVHIMLAVALTGVILVQQSEGGALGMGGGGMSGFMTGRSAANLLTRSTAILAACFFATSIALALLSGRATQSHSIMDNGAAPSGPTVPGPLSPGPATAPPAPAAPAGNAAPAPAAPSAPSVPLAK